MTDESEFILFIGDFKTQPLKRTELVLQEREEVIQVSCVPGCAWSCSSLASCNYCVERARPTAVCQHGADGRVWQQIDGNMFGTMKIL